MPKIDLAVRIWHAKEKTKEKRSFSSMSFDYCWLTSKIPKTNDPNAEIQSEKNCLNNNF